MADTFDLAAVLTEVAQGLVAGGVRSASPDPLDVVLPGVWVQVAGFQPSTYAGGYDVDLVLYLVADFEAGHMRAVKAVSRLYRQVAALYPPTGRVVPVLASFTDDTTMPALSIPCQIVWTPDVGFS